VSEAASPSSISVRVRLFAAYREAAGRNQLETRVAPGATVGDLVDQLAGQVPSLKQSRGLVAVNHTYVQLGTILHDGDEVALIPPVSGGR